MRDSSFMFLTFLFSMVPNLPIAWGFTTFTHGDWKTFGITFAVLIGLRWFFTLVDALVNIASWKLYRKKFVVRKIVEDFRKFQFPVRNDRKEDWLQYLTRIQQTEALPFSVRRATAFMEGQMDIHDK